MSAFNTLYLTKLQAEMVVSCIATLRHNIEKDLLHDDSLGICFNLGEIIDSLADSRANGWFNSYELTSECATTWPLSRAPGEMTSYPVRRTEGFRMWEGPNLEARLSLIAHIESIAKAFIKEAI